MEQCSNTQYRAKDGNRTIWIERYGIRRAKWKAHDSRKLHAWGDTPEQALQAFKERKGKEQ